MNLLMEIYDVLDNYDYDIEDIANISIVYLSKPDRTHKTFASRVKFKNFDIKQFLDLAAEIEYNNGFGTAYINSTLQIDMKDGGVFIRQEYDGREWFEFVAPRDDLPTKLEKATIKDILMEI